MNWRGETFYSRNTVRQLGRGSAPNMQLPDFLAAPGPRKWLLVEQSRLAGLRSALPSSWKLKTIETRNVKFALAVAEPVGGPPQKDKAPLQNPNENGASPVQQSGSGGVQGAPALPPAQGSQGAPP
jgi:hypothetical protein